MVTIETDHGTYTGDDVKAATRAAKKGEREAQKLAIARNERHKLAVTRAESEAFRMLMRKANGGFSRWELSPRGSRWCHVQVRDADTCHPRDVVKFEIHEATDRCAVHNCGYSPMVMGTVCNGGGWHVGVFFKDIAGVVEFYALGANEDALAFVLVPGITMDDFPKRDD